MSNDQTMFQQLCDRAEAIYAKHIEGADMDEAIDAGEFSGPAHDRAAEREIKALVEGTGFTVESVEDELLRRANEGTGEEADNA